MNWIFQELTKLDGITEGPIWADTVLYFTHIPSSRIMCYHPATGQVFPHITSTQGTNGLMLDRGGFLYACEGGGRRMVQYGSSVEPLEICSSFEGRRLNSPNDVAVDRQGRVWFTDPRYGVDRSDMELIHESVYRLSPNPDGIWACERMTFDTTSPNGLLLSRDESILYVAESKYGDSQKRELRAYPILREGTLGPFEVMHNFYPHRGIDGMCLDAEGNIVATSGWEISGPGSMINVFAPNGRILETHPVPCDRPTNCTFGGPLLQTLFVTSTDGHLLQAQTGRRGYLPYLH